MTTAMTDEEFIEFLIKGQVETRLGDKVVLPESMYKRETGELNAEKTLVMVLKARSRRGKKTPVPEPVK